MLEVYQFDTDLRFIQGSGSISPCGSGTDSFVAADAWTEMNQGADVASEAAYLQVRFSRVVGSNHIQGHTNALILFDHATLLVEGQTGIVATTPTSTPPTEVFFNAAEFVSGGTHGERITVPVGSVVDV